MYISITTIIIDKYCYTLFFVEYQMVLKVVAILSWVLIVCFCLSLSK